MKFAGTGRPSFFSILFLLIMNFGIRWLRRLNRAIALFFQICAGTVIRRLALDPR